MSRRLVDRHPKLDASQLAARFVPPHRFEGVRFDTFDPNPDHPSQAAARADLVTLVQGLARDAAPSKGRFGRRRGPAPVAQAGSAPAGRYLDGGYGVGKTHLLASVWHEAPEPKSYLTFEELTAFIGFVGMEAATGTFRNHTVLCIDEFELDDVANTRMAVTFLRAVVGRGTRVITTSNAVPDRLGEGRFNAEDFAREIGEIASHFEALRIDGPDYRAAQHAPTAELLEQAEVDAVLAAHAGVTVDAFGDVLAHLRKVHPVHYSALLDGVDAVVLTDVAPIENQGAALLFVQLVDEIYDSGIAFAATGCAVREIFPDEYRRGGFRKKYGRCESRLTALLGEARALERVR